MQLAVMAEDNKLFARTAVVYVCYARLCTQWRRRLKLVVARTAVVYVCYARLCKLWRRRLKLVVACTAVVHACHRRLAVCAAATNSVTFEYIRYNLRQFQSVSVAGECVATRGSI